MEKGDLIALYTALEWCYTDIRGWSVTSAANPDPEMLVEMPVWLLRTLQELVYRGIHGRWPVRKGRLSTEANRYWAEQAHLVRTYWVLRARKAGIPWEEVYERVSDVLHRKYKGKRISPRTIEASYNKVAKAFYTSGGLAEFRVRFPVPEEWKP